MSAKGLPCLPAPHPWVPLNGARSSAGHVNKSAQQAPRTADDHRKPSPLVRDLLPAFLRLLSIKGVAKRWAVSGAHSWPLPTQKAWEVVVTAVKDLVGAPSLSSHGAPAPGSCSDFTPTHACPPLLRLMAGNLTISPAALRVGCSQWRVAFHCGDTESR